jgi:hypothetical protein
MVAVAGEASLQPVADEAAARLRAALDPSTTPPGHTELAGLRPF